MGGFYGSVQVRGSDVETVRAAAERIASSMKIKCLIGPALASWIGIYPENSGQDEKVGERIARDIGGDVLHVLVHDDDIFAYWLWRGGKLVDSFHSKPGYFGEEHREAEEQMRGNAAAFDWLSGPQKAELAKSLDREEMVVFEVERLEEFGKILGISNLISSYEYLKSGETEDIEQWEQFIEIPAAEVAKEKTSAVDEKRRLKKITDGLRKSGILLAEETRSEVIPHLALAGDGIVVGWAAYPATAAELQLYKAPWFTPLHMDLPLSSDFNLMTSDTAGRFIAIAAGGRITVLDTSSWALILDLESDGHQLHLSPQKLLAFAGSFEVAVCRIDDGSQLLREPFQGASCLATHPSGWLAIARNNLHFMRFGHEQESRELLIGGVSPQHELVAPMIQQHYASFDMEKMKAEMEKAFASAKKRLEKMGMPQAEIDKTFKAMREQSGAMQGLVDDARAGKRVTPIAGEERPASLEFSRDGRLLFCGTDRGMRVYEWQSIIESKGNSMPSPKWRHDAPPAPLGQTVEYIYALAEEPSGAGLIFAGLAGRLFRMDLQTGKTTQLLEMPDGASIIEMVLTPDGKTLATASRNSLRGRGRRSAEQSILRIWDYAALAKL